jgi:hypothetical protein
MAESSIAETMHGALLEALRHREQEIFSYLAILVPALGGFLWLLLHRSTAGSSGDLALFAGTLGTLLLFFLGVGYSLTLGYNFRYVTFQLAKIEHHLEVGKVILQGWPRSPQAFKKQYRLWGFAYCAPPEMIKIFWAAFLIGMLWVIVVYWSIGTSAPHRWVVVSVGTAFFLSGFGAPFWFGRKLERLFSKEGDDWKEKNGTSNEQQPPMVPVGVGNAPAQRRFIQRHQRFLAEYPKLFELYSKMFIRAVEPPDENERQALLHLPDDAPAVIAFEDRSTANYLIFYLGRMAADDFGEILELSGNGAGFAAFIHLRSMYERLITAMYLAKKPSEARNFAENSPIYKLNYLTRLRELIPELKTRYDDAFMDHVRKDAEAAKAKKKQSVCSKCHQPVTNEAWTRVSLDVMAREVDSDLEKLYGPIYIEGTCQAHANSLGIERRLIETENGYQYKDISEDEAALAVQFAHRLMLRLIYMQNSHFKLNLDDAIRERYATYNAIWSAALSASSEGKDQYEVH